MELAFVVSAIRRYAWVVVAFALLGAVPGLLSRGGEVRYDSRGVLQIVPPVDLALSYAGDPDRYVVGELSLLQSTSFAESVAESVTNTDAGVVASLVSFAHEPKTDIVEVVASSADPAFSRRIVDGYLSTYANHVEEQIVAAQEPVDRQIDDVRSQLDEVNRQIAEAMAPYLTAEPAVAGEAYPPIPGVDQVVPSLASSQSLLVNTLVDLQQERARIQSNQQVSGIVVQEATDPGVPVADSNNLAVALGLVGGAFVGVLVAVAMARLSPRVLDHLQAEEILGAPIAGVLPKVHRLAADRRSALQDTPRAIIPFVDWLCVRAEASSSGSDALTVVVVGTQRSAGATTLASAIASRFAAGGSNVLLIDADHRDAELTALYADPNPDNQRPTRPTNGQPISTPKRLHHFTPTVVPNLEVASFGGRRSMASARRHHVQEAIVEARAVADVIVFDGGPLMAAASTVQLARVCDVVIVAMPAHQDARSLGAIAGALRNRTYLTVSTPGGRRSRLRRFTAWLRRLGRRDRSADGDFAVEGEEVDSLVDDTGPPEPKTPASARSAPDRSGTGVFESAAPADDSGS